MQMTRIASVFVISVLGLSCTCRVVPSQDESSQNGISSRDTQNSTSFVNGSLALFPKCNVLRCTTTFPATPSRTQPHLAKRTPIDQSVHSDLVLQDMRETYIETVNTWWIRTIDADGWIAGVRSIYFPPREQPAFYTPAHFRMPPEQYFTIDYFIPAWLLANFAEVNRQNVLAGVERDLYNLTTSLRPPGPRNPFNRMPHPELSGAINDPGNVYGTDVATISSRNWGYAYGNWPGWINMGSLMVRQMHVLEERIWDLRWFDALGNIQDALDSAYPDSRPRMGRSFVMYARSVRLMYLRSLERAYHDMTHVDLTQVEANQFLELIDHDSPSRPPRPATAPGAPPPPTVFDFPVPPNDGDFSPELPEHATADEPIVRGAMETPQDDIGQLFWRFNHSP